MAQSERLSKHLEKLSLSPGDVLIVHDLVTMKALRGLAVPGVTWPVPILLLPCGGLETATKQELMDALTVIEVIESAQTVGGSRA